MNHYRMELQLHRVIKEEAGGGANHGLGDDVSGGASHR
jgi:hypothetical protein